MRKDNSSGSDQIIYGGCKGKNCKKCNNDPYFKILKNDFGIIFLLIFCAIGLALMLWVIPVRADDVIFDTEGNQYNKSNNDIISKSFNACTCLKEGRKVFKDLRDDQIEQLCIESYTKVLMEKSKATNSIQVGSYMTCQEK